MRPIQSRLCHLEIREELTKKAITVVTGGHGGMGKAICKELGKTSAIVLAGRNPAKLETAKAELDELGVESDLCKTDIADRAQVQALADYAASLGSVKQIIHTSGVSPSDTGTENIIKINAVGAVNMVEAFYPVLAGDGVMINFASVAAYTMPQTDEWTEAFEAWNEPNFYDRLLSHAHASETHRQSTGNCRKSAGADSGRTLGPSL